MREEYEDLNVKDYINHIQKEGEKTQYMVDQSKAFNNHNQKKSYTQNLKIVEDP